ncbi:MAG: hypothetical protein M3067_02880 [Chloroflexota bacterium]|nr:hypothetical protein [Chloroflexota bacterium]
MNRTLAALLALVSVATACSPTVVGPGWLDANLHAVDGYLVTGETRCALGQPDGCGGVVPPAVGALKSFGGDVDVVGAWEALLPTQYVDAAGNHAIFKSGASHLVILDLANGTRRAVGVFCRGPLTDQSGLVVEQGSCFSDRNGLLGAFEQFRVGWTP